MKDPVVYDKAKWHYSGDYPKDLPDDQAFVHTGMYLGWIIERNLYSEDFERETGPLITQFKSRQVTGSKIYEWWDGCLIEDMLNDVGNSFSQSYFDFKRGQFLADYEELLAGDLPSLYYVPDTWENYEKLRARIDERYDRWKQQGSKKRWRFWRR